MSRVIDIATRISFESEMLEIFKKCMELRADGRYYPTEAGCVRLKEWLAEKGFNADVSIGDDERFSVEYREHPSE